MGGKYQSTKLLLVRGLLGAYMPGHFKRVQSHFRELGFAVEIAPTLPHGTLFQNAKRLRRYLEAETSNRLAILAHSKGGIETLLALRDLGRPVQSVVLMQTPRRGAPYLSSVFRKAQPRPSSSLKRLRESTHGLGLTAIGARAACLEIATKDYLPGVEEIEKTNYPFPIYSFSSFSKHNSNWVELQAGRIDELEPGKLNDGVFLTQDQVWSGFRHKELDFELDHAEPTVGSARIHEPSLWENLLRENEILPGLSR